MKILVTGGAGFIGKYLVNFLIKKGNDVTIYDNFSNSEKKQTKAIVDERVKIIEGDICELKDLIDAIEDHEIVIHLAAKISVNESIKNPSETFQTNTVGTKNVIVACKKNGIKKLIVASSAAVYGEGIKNEKLNEESEKNPISPYGESKLKMEEELKNSILKNNIKIIILRFFNIYGIGQSPEYAGVITKFLRKIKNNESLNIFGDGMQTRDFISIQDVVNSINNAIKYNQSGIFNIASGEEITIKKLAQLMISLSEKKLDIQYLSPKEGDINFSETDVSLAKNKLKYICKIGIKDGIKELMK
jgi:UDP-glucose 4-epimerase